MRQLEKVNFGDTITLQSHEGEKTVCRVSVDDLPKAMRTYAEFGSFPWTVYVRPLPTVYTGDDTTVLLYPTLRIISGNGGMSLKRDVGATVFNKISGAGSYVEVRARWTDQFGVTAKPASVQKGTQSIVNVVISVGEDPEGSEPQLWWYPFQVNAIAVPIKLPGLGGAADPRVTMQRLRGLRARYTGGGAATLFLQTHDLTAAPGGGEVPLTSDVIAVEPGVFIRDFGAQGRDYSRGLWVVMSTTEDVFTTVGAAGSWRLEAQLYRLDSGDGTS